jgi:hypothetical protein
VEITIGLFVPAKPLASVFFAASNGAVNAESCKNFLRFMFNFWGQAFVILFYFIGVAHLYNRFLLNFKGVLFYFFVSIFSLVPPLGGGGGDFLILIPQSKNLFPHFIFPSRKIRNVLHLPAFQYTFFA